MSRPTGGRFHHEDRHHAAHSQRSQSRGADARGPARAGVRHRGVRGQWPAVRSAGQPPLGAIGGHRLLSAPSRRAPGARDGRPARCPRQAGAPRRASARTPRQWLPVHRGPRLESGGPIAALLGSERQHHLPVEGRGRRVGVPREKRLHGGRHRPPSSARVEWPRTGFARAAGHRRARQPP